MIEAVAIAWAIWCLVNLLAMALATTSTPAFTGFRVIMPETFRAVLTPDEFEAVRQHELGHRHHLHPWKNYLRVCFFMTTTAQTRAKQEFEADDFAAARCGPLVLASALRKLSGAPFDQLRAQRLWRQFMYFREEVTDGSEEKTASVKETEEQVAR